jgi:hypothetical protein
MKALFILFAIGLSLTLQAEEPKFKTCEEGDLNLLNVAQVMGDKALKNFIDDEVVANQASCIVSKPRFVHPAVCGTMITQIDTFILNTSKRASYTIVVDSSYRSCLRYRRIPVVKTLKYEVTPRMIRFP